MAIAWRYVMSVLLSTGLGIIYGLRVNINVAIVSMINNTALQEQGYNVSTSNKTKVDGPLIWSPTEQGNLLSSYYWGYILVMFVGSQLAEILSAKWVFFVAVTMNVVGSLVMPIACKIHFGFALAARLLQGLGGGVTFPTTHVLLAHWAPPIERSLMGSIAFSGTLLGTVLSNALTGLIAHHMGWEWVFYLMGGLSILWLPLWYVFVTDKPAQLRFIGEEELALIESSLGEGHKKIRHIAPFLKILKSIPFWAILIAHTCSNWAFYILLTNMPIFMSKVLYFGTEETAYYSAIPYILMWIVSIALGKILDIYRKKQKLTTGAARKIATLIASVPTAICLSLLCFFGTSPVPSIIIQTIGLGAMGAMYCGFMTNHIDIANNYAGTLMGMTNTIATIPGIVGPIFVGELIEDDPSINSWRIIFAVTCGFLLVEILVFTIFAKGEEQPWNKIPPKEPEAST